MKRCARCRGSHLQCADCELEDGPTLIARALRAEAEVERLRRVLETVSVVVGRALYPEGGHVAPRSTSPQSPPKEPSTP